MKTRLRVIQGTPTRVSVLVYIGPNELGRTEAVGNLIFSNQAWKTFYSLIYNNLSPTLYTSLSTFLETYIEENSDEDNMLCEKCHMLDEEHYDECPVLLAQTLFHQIRDISADKNKNLVIEEDKR